MCHEADIHSSVLDHRELGSGKKRGKNGRKVTFSLSKARALGILDEADTGIFDEDKTMEPI